MKRNVALSIGTGLTIAVILWLSLDASDAIFQSRLLPWVRTLIYLQDIGFRVASRFFPCQKEGFDTGCEAYKTIPAFVGTNALLYSIVSLPLIYLLRMKATAKSLLPVGYEGRVVPPNIRLLAGTTGCVTGIAFLGLSETLSLLGIFLILGAIVVGWLPRAGRWLIVGAALFGSLFILPIFLSHPVEIIRGPFVGTVAPVRLRSIGGPHDLTFLPMSLSWLLSPILLLWCDTALLIEAVKGRLSRPTIN
jgi:hypothetical protein